MRPDLTSGQWVATFGDTIGPFHTAKIHLYNLDGFVMIHESRWNKSVLAEMANELATITRYNSRMMETIH